MNDCVGMVLEKNDETRSAKFDCHEGRMLDIEAWKKETCTDELVRIISCHSGDVYLIFVHTYVTIIFYHRQYRAAITSTSVPLGAREVYRHTRTENTCHIQQRGSFTVQQLAFVTLDKLKGS